MARSLSTANKRATRVSAARARAIISFLAATCFASLVGCQVVGPGAIQHGRIDYNEVIARTSKEQTLANIIRVNNKEPTAFMEVTEVDAAVLSSAGLSGGVGGIGAGIRNTSGQVGSIAGTLQYTESPTIRYQPLLGQALISQLSTPVTVSALSNLVSSGWAPQPVLDFALDRLTPEPTKRRDALEAIQRLWQADALIIGSAKSQKLENNANVKTQAGIGNVSVQVNSGSNGGSGGAGTQDDSIVLYFNERALGKDVPLWKKLLNIYKGTQDKGTPDNEIVLRTKPGVTPGSMPIIQIRSALGILKTSMFYDRITFVTPDQFAKRAWKTPHLDYILQNETSLDDRHYLLIVHSPTPPLSRSYAMHFDAQTGEYYYIADEDDASKNNFTLLNLFLIMQATAAPPSLTPTISVGPSASGG
jgi:hypothetical protein